MRYVSRFFSIYVTRLLLPTNITANQVSFAMVLTGMISTLFFLSSSKALFLTGAILLQFWYILDCADGEVARYRYLQKTGSGMKKESSVTGMYFDIINHYIVNLLAPAMLGLGLFYKTGVSLFAGMGIVAALGQVLTLAMQDARNRAILTYLREFSLIEVMKPPPADPSAPKKRKSLAQWAFAALHYTMTYPTVMNLIFVTAILDLVCPAIPWRWLSLSYLAVGSGIVTSIIIGRTITQGLLDKERQTQFRVSD